MALFLFLTATFWGAQNPAPAPPAKNSEQASASPSDPAKAYYHFMLARRYRELAGISNRGDLLDLAISEYKQGLEADPDSLFLRTELAELYWQARRVDDAVREAESVLKVNPDYEDAHRLLVQVYSHNLKESESEKVVKENLNKAIGHLEAVARINPSDPDVYVSLGQLYKLNNESVKAEEAFKKALNKEPTSKNALANLAQLYFEQGEYEPTIDSLNKIPEEDLDPQLLGMLAFAYSQTHDFNRAVAIFEKALAQEPDNLQIRRAYAEVLMGSGKTEAARNELERILKAEPEDGATLLRLAQLDMKEGRFDQARQQLERAKGLLPDSLEVPYQQALLEDLLGNQDKAIQTLQALLRRSERPEGRYTPAEGNNRAVFLERLGLIYRAQEKFDRALETFKQVVALGKNQAPRGESLIIETLRLGRRPQDAMSEADAAVQKYPEDRALRVLRATLLGEQGRAEEATQQLQLLLKNTPADREVYLAIAQVYSQAKHFPEAESAVQKALAVGSKSDDQEYVLFLLGSIYEREKKFDLAEQQFKKVLSTNPLNAAAANYLGYMLADRGVRPRSPCATLRRRSSSSPITVPIWIAWGGCTSK
jgi:tetratricopeptide (TPR) repeat protein